MWRAGGRSRTVSALALVTTVFVLSVVTNYRTLRISHLKSQITEQPRSFGVAAYFTNATSTYQLVMAGDAPAQTLQNTAHSEPVVNTTGQLPLLVTVQLLGGLGNLMFKYASLLGVARQVGRKPFIRPGTILDLFFQISSLEARNEGESEHENWDIVEEADFARYNSSLLGQVRKSRSNVTLSGYLQSWKYFDNVTEEVRREFTFTKFIERKAGPFLQQLWRTASNGSLLVGVHVRRGDFLASRPPNCGYVVPEVTYYLKAFDWMRRRFAGRKILFLVASDDLQWCRDNLAGQDVVLMPEASPGYHLFLLASCDHVIMSVGTFGWWGAWLANGLVVYYADFPHNSSDLALHFTRDEHFPPHWIGLGN